MSESVESESMQYDAEYSEYSDSDCTEMSEITCTSLEAALAEMTSRLAELDEGLHSMSEATQILEHPLTSVAITAFTNPQVLATAPFRATNFRLLPSAKTFLGMPHHIVTFAELCAAIRKATHEKRDECRRMWGTTEFLGILHHLSELVE
jgi:hypothetical protein